MSTDLENHTPKKSSLIQEIKHLKSEGLPIYSTDELEQFIPDDLLTWNNQKRERLALAAMVFGTSFANFYPRRFVSNPQSPLIIGSLVGEKPFEIGIHPNRNTQRLNPSEKAVPETTRSLVEGVMNVELHTLLSSIYAVMEYIGFCKQLPANDFDQKAYLRLEAMTNGYWRFNERKVGQSSNATAFIGGGAWTASTEIASVANTVACLYAQQFGQSLTPTEMAEYIRNSYPFISKMASHNIEIVKPVTQILRDRTTFHKYRSEFFDFKPEKMTLDLKEGEWDRLVSLAKVDPQTTEVGCIALAPSKTMTLKTPYLNAIDGYVNWFADLVEAL